MESYLLDGDRRGRAIHPWWHPPATILEIALEEEGEPDASILMHDALHFMKAAEAMIEETK